MADPKPTAAAAACISAADPQTSTSAELNAYSGLTPTMETVLITFLLGDFKQTSTDHDENGVRQIPHDDLILRPAKMAFRLHDPDRDVLQCLRHDGGLHLVRLRRCRRH